MTDQTPAEDIGEERDGLLAWAGAASNEHQPCAYSGSEIRAGIRLLADEITLLRAREAELREQIDTPLTDDFTRAVDMEALHQRERWGASHDAGKTPFDWFWLIGYLAQKAAEAAMRGDTDKAKHHTISTAAALANWHLAISGIDTRMRPGIDTPDASIRGEG